MVIDTGTQRTILLLNKEEACGGQRGGWTKGAMMKSLCDIVLHRASFCSRQGVEVAMGLHRDWQEVNGQVVRAMGWQLNGPFVTKDVHQVSILLWDG